MIVANLRASGMNYIDIAMKTGFSTKELAGMESETFYPPYISIMKLLDLHYERCPKGHRRIEVKE
jgi:hypothetical protein